MREGAEGGLARVSTMAAIEETQCIITGTSKGAVQILRLEFASKDSRTSRGIVSKVSNTNTTVSVQKYQVKGEIEKLITFKNDARRNCFSFITAESYIGLQDIRMKD
jgi:hypothetical protein